MSKIKTKFIDFSGGIMMTGNLQFAESGDFLLAGNRYAFRYSLANGYGLYFNETDVRFDFNTMDGTPVFHINGDSGAVWAMGTITAPAVKITTGAGAGKVFTSDAEGAGTWQTPAGGKTISVISGNTNAVKDTLFVLTATLTLTLPASPAAGDTIRVSNLSGTTTAVIARNGNKIMNLAEDLTIDKLNAGLELTFINATYGWVII